MKAAALLALSLLGADALAASKDRVTRILVDKSDRQLHVFAGDRKIAYTYGCIALSNEDMQRLWGQVCVPMPIEIVP